MEERYYFFNSPIKEETVKPLVDFIQNNPGKLLIAIYSGGGDFSQCQFLSKILDINKERISLLALTDICSCAFLIFRNFKGKKYLGYDCTGLYHRGSKQLWIASNLKPNSISDKECFQVLKYTEKYELKYAKEFLTPKEFKRFKDKNADIFFSPKRMKKLFPDAEIIY